MNKHVHRLVFDRRRGMRVPAAEHARSSGKAAGGQTRAVAVAGAVSLLMGSASLSQAQLVANGGGGAGSLNATRVAPRALSATRSVSGMVSQTLSSGRPNLPVYSKVHEGLNKGEFDKPVESADGLLMTLLQKSGAIVVHWDSFDIAKGYTVRFIQPEGGRALNKVHNADPSWLDGTLQATGEVMLENTAGIIFGKNARVDARSMVATALRIGQSVFDQAKTDFSNPNDPRLLNLRSLQKGEVALGGNEADTAGFVSVEAGAVIRTLPGGNVILVAPRVVNQGLIETPQGQAILAAGKTVYLHDPTDLAQRGLLVAVDNFTDATLAKIQADVAAARAKGEVDLNEDAAVLGTVENTRQGGSYTSGLIRADKGTINLVGTAIRQKGQLTATTAVKGQNGAIFLTAMKDTFTHPDGRRDAKTLGGIELGQGSITEVLPSVEGLVLSDAQRVEAVIAGEQPGQDVVVSKIGVRPDEVMRVRETPAEPQKPSAPAEDASAEAKATYQAKLAQYEADKKVYDATVALMQRSSDVFYRSRIDLIGKDITLRSGSRVQAPAGEVNILAAADWEGAAARLSSAPSLVKDGSRIVMEAGSVVDVSGLDNLRMPAQRNQLEGRLFSLELADSPVQRDGVAYRSTLLADARRRIDLGDLSGYYSNLRYTAAEYSTAGGLTRILSQGELLLDRNARVDFSGGALTYDGGTLVSSVLQRNGLITRVEDAKRDVRYNNFISNPTQSDTDDLTRLGLSQQGLTAPSTLASQLVGKSAGVAHIAAPTASLEAQLDGSVRMSDAQRYATNVAERDRGLDTAIKPFQDSVSPVWAGLADLRAADREVKQPVALSAGATDNAADYQPHLFATLKPTAGLLILGREFGNGGSKDQPGGSVQQEVVIGAAASGAAGASLRLSAGFLSGAQLGGLTVFANRFKLGDAASGDAPVLQLATGGSFTAKALASDVNLNGAIVVPGGKVSVTALGGNVNLTSGSKLDVGGTRRDDRFAGESTSAAALQGGSVSLQANQSVNLAAGSEIEASGTAWRRLDGQLVKGKAGGVTLQANLGAAGTSSTLPTGTIDLDGSISGFDFTSGGSLTLKGLPRVVLGGELAGHFSVGSELFANRGFGKLTIESLGDVVVAENAVIQPKLVNMVALPSRRSVLNGVTHETDVLEAGLRSGLSLSLSASTAPNVTVQNGLPKGANLTVSKNALLDMGLGGNIALTAGGSIEHLGTLRAWGGSVSLGLLGKRGGTTADAPTDAEDFGYLQGQRIHLAKGSLIDASGAVKSRKVGGVLGVAEREVGEVLAAGTVTLGGVDGTPVRGQLQADVGSTIQLNGATALLDRDVVGGKTRISSAAGTLNIMSTDGFSLLGTVEAKAPDASVAGGTINIALSREGKVDNTTGGVAYPTKDTEAGKRTIRVAGTQTAAESLNTNERLFGEGVLSAELLNNAGFDRVQLRADESVQLNRGASIQAAAGRSRLQSVVIDAPVLELKGEAPTDLNVPTHVIQAHHVSMGPIAGNGGTPGTAAASARVLSGKQQLEVQAGLIEVHGDTAVQGAQRVDLNATLGRSGATSLDRRNGEIRFIGERALKNPSLTDRKLSGQFSFNGALNLRAGQVYATTLSDFKVLGQIGSTLNIFAPAAGSTSQQPLSALASLKLKASKVKVDGVIRQPVGTIDIDADTLTLTERAALSVSAEGVAVPVGHLVNGNQWLYSPQGQGSGDIPTVDNAIQDITKLPVKKQITLKGTQTLSLDPQSVADVQAGGDIVGWQFNKGVGGSTDTLLRPNVFAVLPNYGYDFAPHDAEIRATTRQQGSAFQVGDQVTITTANNVLAAGTYTLLDARYGILPGAVLVSATQLDVTRALPVAVQNDDGSVKVSGHRTATGTAQNGGNDLRQALLLEPESTFRRKSDISVISGNAYQDARAARDGQTFSRPGDGGRLSLSSDQSFNWQARFNFKGANGLRAGEFDLAMPSLVVQRAQPAAGVKGVVSLDQLNLLGAESVMLGGLRTASEDGTQTVITRLADSVTFRAAVDEQGQPLGGDANTLVTPGELWAVAKSNVSVDDGMTIASKGVDTGEARTFEVKNDGALLQVSHLGKTDLRVSGATGQPATLKVGSGAAGAAPVTLSGNAIQLDSTGRNQVGANVSLNAASLGLGAERLAVGEAQGADANALKLQGGLLDQANRAQRLTLRANSSIDFAANTQLGRAGDKGTELITLDAPQLKGVAATDASNPTGSTLAQVSAREVVLRNGSGKAAPVDKDAKVEKGVGQLVIQAQPVLRDGRTGGITVAASGAQGQRWAFDKGTLQSQGDIVFSGEGSIAAQGGVDLTAARVTATGDARQQLKAAGDLTVARATGGVTLNESLGARGQLNLEGRVLTQKGNIDIESGALKLLANGGQDANKKPLSETLVFEAGSTTSVAGRKKQVSDTFAVSSGGGQINAQAKQGAIRLDGLLSAAAPVIPTGVSGDNAFAGTVNLQATGEQGAVLVGRQARIDLSGAAGKTGSLGVDTQKIDLTQAAKDALAAAAAAAAAAQGQSAQERATYAALAKTGLDKLIAISNHMLTPKVGGEAAAPVSDTELAHTDANRVSLKEVNVRLRDGNLDLNAQVKAAMVALTADKGGLSLGKQASIDATTAAGGVVQLQARDDLVLNDGARILARSSRDGANGGDVLLASTQGTVQLGDVQVVADSEGDTQDGRIVIRAQQTDARDGMKVQRLSSGSATQPDSQPVLQAGRVELEGVRIYSDDARTTLDTGTSTDTAWGLDSLTQDAKDFASSTRQAAILAQAGLSNTANASVRAGAEIRSKQAFSVAKDLQLAAVLAPAPGTLGNQPMNLTVRTEGDLNVNGSVSSGFSNATMDTGTVQAGQGASLRFVAGADLTSADVNATQADASKKGHFTLAGGKVIRTTTGSIDVHASGDVRLMAPSATTTSAIYVAGGRAAALAADEVFAAANTPTAKSDATAAYNSAVFTERGERLSVSAGGEVGSFSAVTTDDKGEIKRTQQALTQLSGNYFYHGGNTKPTLPAKATPVAWWSGIGQFRQGFGSFGGGNVDISAGGSVSNVAVVAPTNARNLLKVDGTGKVLSSDLKVLNGGDVSVIAGADIVGGAYFLGRGEGRLSAGGSLAWGADSLAGALPSATSVFKPGAMLALMDGHWSVSAVGDVNVSHVYNPTIVPFRFTGSGNFNGTTGGTTAASGLSNNNASVYYTYGADAGVSLASLQGDVSLAPVAQNFNRLHANSAVGNLELSHIVVGKDASVPASVLPPVVSLVSLAKDVVIDTAGRVTTDTSNGSNGQRGSALFVMPSSASQVNVFAGQDLKLQANLQVLDAQQVQLGLPTASSQALFAATPGANAVSSTTAQNFSLLSYNLGAFGAGVIDPNTTENKATSYRVSTDLFTASGNLGRLGEFAISDLGQSRNDLVNRFVAGRDVVFAERNDAGRELVSFLRSARPMEIVAGQDVVNPNVLGQNFDESDVTKVAAGRDIVGSSLTSSTRVMAVGGPGLFAVEAGRDLNLNQMAGVLALGNAVNRALPEASAKVSVAAGVASAVNLPELLARHGGQPALRSAVNQALVDSGLPVPAGFKTWSDLPASQAFAAFAELGQVRQAGAVQGFLDAAFAAAYLPEDAGQSAAHYRSEAFQRKKQEAMWAQIAALADQAVSIAVSTDAAEEARRVERRRALFRQAEAVAELAGLGKSFVRTGDVNLGQSRVHNLGAGGGDVAGQVNDSLGGIDVVAAGRVLAGLTTSPANPGGFINYDGGSFRSISGGDFLAGDQKVIAIGRGNLLIYSVDGSIDSGKGSNTTVSAAQPVRAFNKLIGQVETQSRAPTSGSGFQQVTPPADVEPKLGLYAPNGEIRALDAFIKGGNLQIVAPAVKGGDNIGGAAGVAPAAAPTVNLSLTPKVADTAAGVAQVADASDTKSKQASSSVLTVDLLGFGESTATAAGASGANGDKANDKANEKDQAKEKEPRQTP